MNSRETILKRFTIKNEEDLVVSMETDMLRKVLDEAIDWDDKVQSIYCDLIRNKDSMNNSEYREKRLLISQLLTKRLIDCVGSEFK